MDRHRFRHRGRHIDPVHGFHRVADTLTSLVTLFLWLKLILIILPPYVFAGMAISLSLTRSPWPVGIVYGTDLVGAAAGCLLVLGLLTWMDGVSALLAVAAIGAAAAACFHLAWRAVPIPKCPNSPSVARSLCFILVWFAF